MFQLLLVMFVVVVLVAAVVVAVVVSIDDVFVSTNAAAASIVCIGVAHSAMQVVSTLEDTSFYHSSSLTASQLAGVLKMAQWEPVKAFPAFDLLRLLAVHPSGSKAVALAVGAGAVFDKALEILSSGTAAPASTALCALRFLGNAVRHEDLRKMFYASADVGLAIEMIKLHSSSSNKQIRLAGATLALNLSITLPSCIASARMPPSTAYCLLLPAFGRCLTAEQELADVVYRVVAGLGTALLLGGPEVLALAQSANPATQLELMKTLWGPRLGAAAVKCIDEVLLLCR